MVQEELNNMYTNIGAKTIVENYEQKKTSALVQSPYYQLLKILRFF